MINDLTRKVYLLKLPIYNTSRFDMDGFDSACSTPAASKPRSKVGLAIGQSLKFPKCKEIENQLVVNRVNNSNDDSSQLFFDVYYVFRKKKLNGRPSMEDPRWRPISVSRSG